MRVIDYISAADAQAVCDEYRRCYPADGWSEPTAFEKFRKVLNDKVGEQTDMRVVISWSSSEDGDYDVVGIDPDGQRWGLDLTSWSKWKLMEVEDQTGHNFSPDQIAAHLYYEITWHGWEEKAIDLRDRLEDQIEALQRGNIALHPFRPEDFE